MGNEELYQGIPNLEGNCTDPLAYFAHENKFIDRQLLMYMVIEQISLTNVTIPPPKSEGIIKAFQIYDQIYDIATKSCTHPYLRIDVMELSSKFFRYLHRANKLEYDIRLSEDDFNWIQTILSQCKANMTQYKLYSEPDGECPGLSPWVSSILLRLVLGLHWSFAPECFGPLRRRAASHEFISLEFSRHKVTVTRMSQMFVISGL